MKKIIEKTLRQGTNPYEEILKHLQMGAWVWISDQLYRQLCHMYENDDFRCASPRGKIFWIRQDTYDNRWHEKKGLTLSVECDRTWNKVRGMSGLLEKNNPKSNSPVSPSNPELLVFLS